MRLSIRYRLFFLLACCLPSAFCWAEAAYVTFPSDVDWVTRESDHFYVLYRRGQDRLAERALKAGENAYKKLTPVFPPGPDHTWIVLADFVDSTNGYSLDLPWPHIVIFVSPPEPSGQLSALDDWFDSVILHEYTHTLHIYPANGLWGVARTIFGSWVLPNALMPSHFHEGLAVLMETEKSAGGRGRGNEFSMYRRMAVDSKIWGTDDFLSRDQMDGSVTKWPGGTSAYFFGYQLWKELYARKGEKGIYDLVLSHSSNWPFFQNIPLSEVFKTDYPTLWTEIFNKGATQANAEIAKIKQEPLSLFTPLTHNKFSKWDLALSPDNNRAIFRRWNLQEGAALDVIDLKNPSHIESYPLSGSMSEGICWRKLNGKDVIAYLEITRAHGYATNRLKFYDLNRKSKLEVDKADLANLHHLACSPTLDRVRLYQERAGKGRVVEQMISRAPDQSYQAKVGREWKLPEGSWVTSLLVAKDFDLIGLRDGLSTGIYRWGHNETVPKEVARLKGHYYSFRAGNQEGEVWAIGNHDGRQEIWSLDLIHHKIEKRLAVLGGVNSFERLGNDLLFSNYTHGGYDIARAPSAQLKMVDMPLTDDPGPTEVAQSTPAITEGHEYNPLRTVLPRTWIPNILFVPNGAQFGVWIPGFDISQKHVYNLVGGYDWRTTQGLPFVDLTYQYRFGKDYNANVELYYAPSYFITEQLYLKQWGLTAGLGALFDFIPPALSLNVVYKRMEAILTNPSQQSVALPLTATQKLWFKQRPLSTSPIRGTEITVSHSQFFKFMGSNDNYFSSYIGIDQYVENPFWREHVFFLGSRFGYTEGTTFLNNYFTAGGELIFQQGRANFLNRGFYPQTFFGRRIGNFNLEYRFPITRIDRGWGYWPFKLKVLHAALVADTTTVDNGPVSQTVPISLFRTFYTSAGAELKSDWTFSSYLPVQVRIGVYHGFGQFGENVYATLGLDASL